MTTIDELKRYITINKAALDDELIRQPSLFYEVSEAYTEAVSERDALKEQLAIIDAKLDSEVRSKINDTKAREGYIASQVKLDKRHKDAFAKYLEAKEIADKLDALKDAFKQRSYMLRDLAQLYMANYFGETSVRATAATDHVVYNERRARLAAGREAKK